MEHRILLPLVCVALAALGTAAQAAPAQHRYYSILIEGKKAGYGHYQVASEGKGVKVTSDVVIKVKMLGTDFDMNYQAVATYARPGDPLPTRYTITLDAGQTKTTSDCRFSGRTVQVQADASGAKGDRTVHLPDGCYLLEGNLIETWERMQRALGSFRGTRTVQVFEPLSGTVVPLKLTWKQPQTLVAEISGQQLQGRWDPRQHLFVSLAVPGQKAVFRLADKNAMKDLEGIEAASRAFAVSDVAFDDPGELESVTLSVKASVVAEKISVASLQRPTQSFSGTVKNNTAVGTFTIRKLVYKGEHAPPFPPGDDVKAEWARFLKPEARIESDDPDIIALAKKLTDGAKDSWDAAQKIGQWVFGNIHYKITGAGAKACLAAKEGDCGPHTMLTVALLRAASIPARTTGGALYSSLLGGSFGQHYWTRVWMGEQDGWIPIDTTSGEIGTLSPTHLTLWNLGGMGSLSVNVVDYSPKGKGGESKGSETASRPLRRPLQLKADERWEYVFSEDGNPIGKETARVQRLDADGGAEIAYTVDLTQGQTKIHASGVLTIASDATPRRLEVKLTAGGIEQNVTVTVRNGKAKAVVEAAGKKAERMVDLPAGGFLGLATTITPWDLIMRSLPWEAGKTFDLRVYLVDALQMDKTALKVAREETVSLGGHEIACFVLQDTPEGWSFTIRKDTGQLVRMARGQGKGMMLIERRF
jgi:transglutaminase-like putative cysteine protease